MQAYRKKKAEVQSVVSKIQQMACSLSFREFLQKSANPWVQGTCREFYRCAFPHTGWKSAKFPFKLIWLVIMLCKPDWTSFDEVGRNVGNSCITRIFPLSPKSVLLFSAQALCWDPHSPSRGPAVVLCQVFQQEEGQKTQEKETQTTLRLCKKHIFWTFSGLKAITEHSWLCCKIIIKKKKFKLWLMLITDDFF